MNRPWFLPTITLSALLVSGGLTGTAHAAANPCPYPLTAMNRPIAPPSATAGHASFIDPTVEVSSEAPQFVSVSEQVYIAPFAHLEAHSSTETICIEHASNVQDNTRLVASGGPIHLGVHAIMAHG